MTVKQRQQGLVSTIIPVYNRPSLVVEAVMSVLAQTYRPIEVIVVDDGSTDDTLSVLQSLEKTHAELIVLTQDNAGPGVAREQGRQKAQGEFIQYLDSDDLLFKDKFQLQVAALHADAEAAAAYGKTEATLFDEPLLGVAMRQTGVKTQSMFPDFLRSRWWGTSTPLYRAAVLDKVGPWLSLINEEDWEYDCRIASCGGKLAYVDEFVSHARHHDSNDHLSNGGTTDPAKLKHRCLAQQKIYQHAQAYTLLDTTGDQITVDDWAYYSKSVFLLARQCAAAKLPKQASEMFKLSVEANGGATIQHRFFRGLVIFVGWYNASRIVNWLGK